MNGTGSKGLIIQTEFIGVPCLWIYDQHTGGSVDAAVQHIIDFIFLDQSGRIGAFVIDDRTLAKACVEHPIEDIRMSGLCEDEHMSVGLYGRDQVFVFPCDIQDLYFFQIHVVIIIEIIEPV